MTNLMVVYSQFGHGIITRNIYLKYTYRISVTIWALAVRVGVQGLDAAGFSDALASCLDDMSP